MTSLLLRFSPLGAPSALSRESARTNFSRSDTGHARESARCGDRVHARCLVNTLPVIKLSVWISVLSSVYTLHNKTNLRVGATLEHTALHGVHAAGTTALARICFVVLTATLLTQSQPMSSHQAVEPGRGGRGGAPRQVGMQCAQYLLFFRPEEEDLPGLNGFEPEELPPPLGFLGAGLSLSEPDEEPEYFSLFLAWWGVGGSG